MCIRIKSHCWKVREAWFNLASGPEVFWMRIMSWLLRIVGSCWFLWWSEESWLWLSWVSSRTKSKIASLAKNQSSLRGRKKYRCHITLCWSTFSTLRYNLFKLILTRAKESLLNSSALMLTSESLNLEMKFWLQFPVPTTQRSKNGEALNSA